MKIQMTCSACNEALVVGSGLAGKRVLCPHCRKAVSVPPLGIVERDEPRASAPRRPGRDRTFWFADPGEREQELPRKRGRAPLALVIAGVGVLMMVVGVLIVLVWFIVARGKGPVKAAPKFAPRPAAVVVAEAGHLPELPEQQLATEYRRG
jgi:hypothetical protein